MSVAVVLVSVAGVLAVIAVVSAVIAVRAARAARKQLRSAAPAEPPGTVAVPETPAQHAELTTRGGPVQRPPVDVISGRVVAHPSNRDVIEATMGRPLVRASTLVYGIAHALRPHNRDRILALMRREYRQRRRARLRAGRRAMRASQHQLETGADEASIAKQQEAQ